MYCVRCGRRIPDHSRFCPRCGAPLQVPPGSRGNRPNNYYDPYGNMNNPQNKKKRSSTALIAGILGGLAAMVLLAVLAYFFIPGVSDHIHIPFMEKEEASTGSESTDNGSEEVPGNESQESGGDEDPESGNSENGSEESSPSSEESKVQMYGDDGSLLCGISLTADRTQFFMGEEGTVRIQVSLPEGIFGSLPAEGVRLENEKGTEINSFAPGDFTRTEEDRYSASVSFRVETEKNRTIQLKASAGQYYSPKLMLTVTPHISADQIADCVVIGAELNDRMAEAYGDVSAKERAAAAKDWLDEDSRIMCTDFSEDEETVYYLTNDYITGAFRAAEAEESSDPAKDISGINDGSSTEFFDSGLLTDLYGEYGAENKIEKNNVSLYLAAKNSSVTTNPDALLLIPCPDDMGVGRASYINTLTADHNDYVTHSGGQSKVLTGTDAVGAILNHSVNNYGLVTLFTHGGILDAQFMRNHHNKETIYLMYRSSPFTDLTKDAIHEQAKAKLQEFARTAYQSDDQGADSEDSFYAQWYGEPWTPWWFTGFTRKMIMTTAYNKDGNQYEIWMTSGFIASRYQEQRFDNAVIYLATCKGLLDTEFDEWLLNRGCRYVFGFTVFVRTISNVNYHEALIHRMTEETAEHSNRFRVVQEAAEAIGVPDAAAWGLGSEPVWYSWIGPLEASYSAGAPAGRSNNTLYYVGKNDFIFKGHGELKGHVLWQEDAETETVPPQESAGTGTAAESGTAAVSQEHTEPVSGAKVTAYLLKGRTLSVFAGNETMTDESGAFSFPACPMGYLILKAEAEGIESKPYQICFVDDLHDGGNLFIPKKEGLVLSACIGEYKGQGYKIGATVAELQSLPVQAAKYDYICSFAFYRDKIYYCCKDAGTSDYRMALYEVNPDGTGQRELYAPPETNVQLERFALKDGFLYYREVFYQNSVRNETWYRIDLKTGVIEVSPDTPSDVTEAMSYMYGCFTKNDKTFYAAGDAMDRPQQIIMENADAATETIVSTENPLQLEGVLSAGTLGDLYVYYSTSQNGYRENALYRQKLSSRETVMLDSHAAAGGGGYFNW